MQHPIGDPIQAAQWQVAIAVIQAVVSIALLGWYVLAAHLDRRHIQRERDEDFASLVRLCRDLGLEAKRRTEGHIRALRTCGDGSADQGVTPEERLQLWRADMAVIYVCLNEVPHYEVRNPSFSIALTRLWLEVDGRGVDRDELSTDQTLCVLLERKLARIRDEVEAMASLLSADGPERGGLRRSTAFAGRRGYSYSSEGFVDARL